jgi:general stress protein YciG
MSEEKSRRGFAAMDPEKRREIARKGGKAAHAKGVGHTFSHERAVAAGRKGGRAAHAKGAAHQLSGDEARQAARKGGSARWENRPGGRLAPPRPRPSARKPGENRGRRPDEARRAEAARLRAEGLTLAEIGRRLGVKRQAVHEILRRVAGADGARRAPAARAPECAQGPQT